MRLLPATLQIYGCVLSFVLGTVFGSFINCMAWRMVHGESVLNGRSHCAVCNHALSAGDLIPVFSYFALRGRCRYCHEKISFRYTAAELVLGGAFLLVFVRFGLHTDTIICMALSALLLGLSLVDLDTLEIPDRFPALIAVIWAVALLPGGHPVPELKSGVIGAVVIGGGVLLIDLIFERVRKTEGMGGGDVKLFFVLALYFGVWIGLFHLILSCVIGLVIIALTGRRKIPFGPAISIAAYICLLWGKPLLNWYLGLLGLA
jgi:leader peptidase (prepilin peptidase)/N-methyltransferase